MDTSTILLLVGGIAVLYFFGGQQTVVNPPPAVATGATTDASGKTQQTSAPTGVTASMLQGVANAKLQTADQWNYWYGQITGVHQTAELFVGNRVTEVISASVYLARRHTAGLKGLIW